MESAKSRESRKLQRSDERTSEFARDQFILACWDLASQQIPRSPFVRLHDEVLPRWMEVLTATRIVGLQRYIRNGNINENSERTQAETKRLLESWASDCWLVDNVDNRRPAGWVVEKAQRICELWHRPIGITQGIGAAAYSTDRQTASDIRLPPPLGGDKLHVPMDNPSRQSDETLHEFKLRARKAFNLHLKRLASQEAHNRQIRGGTLEPKAKASRLDHYAWLILYQCCGWPLKDIREVYPYVDTAQAVWNGLSDKARRVGLVIRPRSVKQDPRLRAQ